MKRSDLKFRIKLQVPSLGTTGITDDQLNTLIQQACDEVNLIAKIYKGYTDFNIIAEQQIYPLSTNVPTFLSMSKSGAWYLDSNSDYKRLFPKTIHWLDLNIENWRDASSGEPIYYWQEGDDFGLYPNPDTSRTNGIRLYHLKKATAMGNDDSYPFIGGTTEVTALRPMDDAIIAFLKWKFQPALNEKDSGASYQEYIQEVGRALRQVRRRQDMTSDHDFILKVTNV